MGIDYSYSVRDVAPPGGVPVAFYWATGPNQSNIISAAYSTTLTGSDAAVGDHTKQLTLAQLGTRPAGATHLVMVLDPNNAVAETNETNNAAATALPLVDLATNPASGVALDSTGQGINYTYTVLNQSPPNGVPVAFYWATAPGLPGIIPNVPPAYSTTLTGADAAVGSHTKQLSLTSLGQRPTGATHLVMVLDPDTLIAESDETNNTASLRLPDAEAVSLNWNEVSYQGSPNPNAPATVNEVQFSYRVLGSALPAGATVALYWANGGTLLTEAARLPAEGSIGLHSRSVALSALAPAPPGTTRLVLYIDPASQNRPFGDIPELREDNNTLDLVLYQRMNSSVVIHDAIAEKVALLGADYYRATGKIMVVTSSLRTPAEQAAAMAANLASKAGVSPSTVLKPKPLTAAMESMRKDYSNGNPIRSVLAAYDATKSPLQNIPAWTAVIQKLLTDWIARANPKERPPLSWHLSGRAIDIRVTGMTDADRSALIASASKLGGVEASEKDSTPHVHITFPPPGYN